MSTLREEEKKDKKKAEQDAKDAELQALFKENEARIAAEKKAAKEWRVAFHFLSLMKQ